MSLPVLNFIGVIISLALSACGLALGLIALWQNYPARPNQFLALTMFCMGLWGVPDALYYVAYPAQLDIQFWVNIASMFYGLFGLSFFFFVTEMPDPQNYRVATQMRWIATGVTIVALVIVWLDAFWTTPVLNSQETYVYHVAWPGYVLLGGVVVALALIGNALKKSYLAHHPQVLFAVIPILIGLVSFAIFGAPIGHFINSFMGLVSIVWIGRLVLTESLFNPLIVMLDELKDKNEQLEEVGRRKSEFLANMSHELRTPLNSIIGYTELILSGMYGKLEERQYDRLQKVHRNGRQLLVLINDVLDLSKIDAGRLDLSPVHFSPALLLDEVVKTLEELAAEKRQSLVKHYQDLPLFYVDEVRARQVILNGLANMIKFTAPEKPIQLSGFYDVMRNQIVITMRAMSGGISSADAFKFTQAIQATEDLPSAQFADFGLGLAVSKRLVELHGGRISFDSASSTLQISFPAALEPRRPPTMTTAAMIPNDSRPRILVIDDNLESLEVLQGYLQSADYQVYGALSGHEGLLRAREIQPHLILLDMRMPGMDGWAVLDHLQADERLSHIPLIVMSVTDQQHVIRQVDSVRHAMLKPINRTQLLKNVEKILGVSSALPTQA